MRYQEHLYKTGQLAGYELKMYHRRRRQTLLWKMLLDETVEALPPQAGDGVAGLKSSVVRSAESDAALVDDEIERVLGLGALVADATPEGVSWRWAES